MNELIKIVPKHKKQNVIRRAVALLLLAGFIMAGFVMPLIEPVQTAKAAAPSPVAYGWGANQKGQLGNPDIPSNGTADKPVALKLPAGVNNYTALTLSGSHAAGIGDNGKIYAWGWIYLGSLGDGTDAGSDMPVEVKMPAGVTASQVVAAGNYYAAIGSDNKVYVWGRGDYYNGNTTTNTQLVPTPVNLALPNGVTVTKLGAGSDFILALASDGKIYGWGNGFLGTIGDGAREIRTTPVQTLLPQGVTKYTALSAQDSGHTLALGDNGKLYAWGWNFYRQLGVGSVQDLEATPTEVGFPAGVKPTNIFVAGGASSLALGNNGKLYAWGNNQYGKLCIGGTQDAALPTEVKMPANSGAVVAVHVNNYFSAISTADGKIYTCGATSTLALNPDVSHNDVPVAAILPTDFAGATVAAASIDNIFVLATLKQPQTITFNQPANITFGQTPPALSATSTSGLVVSFASRTPNVCTIVGVTLTVNSAGDCTIAASQAGNNLYSPAADVTRSFTIAKATPAVTLVAASWVVKNAPLTLNASVTANNGRPNGAVSFYDGATVIATANLDGNGLATANTKLATTGTHNLKAVYNGDTNFQTNASLVVPVSVVDELAIQVTSLPGGRTDSNYQQKINVSGGTTPYSYTIIAGTLPPGMTLGTNNGVVSGTPTIAGTYSFTVKVTDANGLNATQNYTITVTQVSQPTPTPSPTATPTSSPTPSPTATATPSPTATPTSSPTPSPTATATPSPTATPTVTPKGDKGGFFKPVTPARLYDSRPNVAISDAPLGREGALSNGQVRIIKATGQRGIPEGATAILANVTVSNAKAGGFLKVFPADLNDIDTASVNWYGSGARVVGNFTFIRLDANGQFKVSVGGGDTDFIIDVIGYLVSDPTNAGVYKPLASNVAPRIYDSRANGNGLNGKTDGKLAKGVTRTLKVAGAGSQQNIPATATAVVMNVTVVDTQGGGYLTLFPAGGTVPMATTVNWNNWRTPGTNIPRDIGNMAIVPVGKDGSISFVVGGTDDAASDVVFDVMGYIDAAGANDYGFQLPQAAKLRLYDSRPTSGNMPGSSEKGALVAGKNRTIKGVGAMSIPTNAKALLVRVTTVDVSGGGFVALFKGDTWPGNSNVNTNGKDQQIGNLAIVTLDNLGNFTAQTGGRDMGIVIDVVAYFV